MGRPSFLVKIVVPFHRHQMEPEEKSGLSTTRNVTVAEPRKVDRLEWRRQSRRRRRRHRHPS